MFDRVQKVAVVLSALSMMSMLSMLSIGCGSSSTPGAQQIGFTASPPAKALSIPGTTCTMGAYANSGRRVTTDAIGAVYLASVCGGQGYVTVSKDGAKTFKAPVGIGLANLTQLTVQGGPDGVAYIVGMTGAGEAYFTRTQDQGATWDVPVQLATGISYTDRGAAIATRGDQVFVQINKTGYSTVYRNATRGTGAFSFTALPTTVSAVFIGLLIDSTGKIWSGLDTPSIYLTNSTDGGVTFGPFTAVAGASAMYSNYGIGADVIWIAGYQTTAYRILVATPTVSTAVTGLATPTASGATTSAVDDAGTAYVASVTAGGLQLQRALIADAAFSAVTTIDAAGAFPSVASPPGTGKVVVAYEKAGAIWTTVQVY